MLPDEFRAAAADLLGVSRGSRQGELIEDRGEAAADDEFFRSRHFLDAEGVTHTLRIESRRRRAARSADRPRDRRGPPSATPISPYGYPGFAGVGVSPAERSPRLRRAPPSTLDPRPDRSTSPPPAWSASSSATRSGRSPLAGADRAQRRPDRRPGAAAEEPAERPPPGPPQPRSGLRARARPRRRDDRRAARRLPRRLRADDAPHRRRAALLLRRRLLRPHPRRRPHLAGARHRPRRRARRRLDRRASATASSTTTSAAAPTRTSRDSPMKNVVARLVEHAAELGPAAQPRRRHHPGRRARGVQARLRQPPAALAHLGARLRPASATRSSAPGREAGGFFPAYRA